MKFNDFSTQLYLRRIGRFVQIFGTLVLTVMLVRQVDWAAFQATLARLHWDRVIGCGLWLMAVHGLNAWRWRCLLEPHSVAHRQVVQYYLAGLFANNFLPTGIGGDGVRAILVARDVPTGWAIMSVSLDRIIGLSALTILLGAGVIIVGLPAGLEFRPATILPQVWLMAIASTIFLALTWRAEWAVRVRRIVASQLSQRFGTSAWSNRSRRQWGQVLAATFLLSVVAQVCLVAANASLIRAFDVNVSSGAAIWVIGFSSLSLLLPVSINGLGLQENLIVMVFGAYGVAPSAGLGVAVLWRLLNLLVSLAGAAAIMRLKPRSSLAKS